MKSEEEIIKVLKYSELLKLFLTGTEYEIQLITVEKVLNWVISK